MSNDLKQSKKCVFLIMCACSVPSDVSRQAYWSGLPCPPSGDLPNPGIEHASPVSNALKVDILPIDPSGKPVFLTTLGKMLSAYFVKWPNKC